MGRRFIYFEGPLHKVGIELGKILLDPWRIAFSQQSKDLVHCSAFLINQLSCMTPVMHSLRDFVTSKFESLSIPYKHGIMKERKKSIEVPSGFSVKMTIWYIICSIWKGGGKCEHAYIYIFSDLGLTHSCQGLYLSAPTG